MSSASIRAEIRRKQSELQQIRQELVTANGDYDNVETFQSKIKTEYSTFLSALDHRRSRIGRLNDVLGSVKVAKAYHSRSTELLSGGERHRAEEQYDGMDTAVSKELQRLRDFIFTLETNIKTLENQIQGLEAEYQRAVAREEAERRTRNTGR